MSETKLQGTQIAGRSPNDSVDPATTITDLEVFQDAVVSQLRRVSDPGVTWSVQPEASLISLVRAQPHIEYREYLYSVGKELITINAWEDNTKSTLLYSRAFTYVSKQLTSETYTRGGISRTKTFSYTGKTLDSIEVL